MAENNPSIFSKKSKAGKAALRSIERLALFSQSDRRKPWETTLLSPRKIQCFVGRSPQEFDAEPRKRYFQHRYVLVIPWKERGMVRVGDSLFGVAPGQAILIFPFQFRHGFQMQRPDALWQIVSFELEDAAPIEALRLSPLCPMKPTDFRLMLNFSEAWLDPARSLEPGCWLTLFLIRMRALASSSSGIIPSPDSQSLLARIEAICLPNLKMRLEVRELADRLFMSESVLRKRIRKETGQNIGDHLRWFRHIHALTLLEYTDSTVSQVADACGFDSIYSFCRAFRKLQGCTATEYRNRFVEKKTQPA